MRLLHLRFTAVFVMLLPLAACSLWEDEPLAPLPPPPVGVTPGQAGITGVVSAPAPQTPAKPLPPQSVPQQPAQQQVGQRPLQTAPVGTVTTGSIPQSTDPRNFAPPYPVRMAFIRLL